MIYIPITLLFAWILKLALFELLKALFGYPIESFRAFSKARKRLKCHPTIYIQSTGQLITILDNYFNVINQKINGHNQKKNNSSLTGFQKSRLEAEDSTILDIFFNSFPAIKSISTAGTNYFREHDHTSVKLKTVNNLLFFNKMYFVKFKAEVIDVNQWGIELNLGDAIKIIYNLRYESWNPSRVALRMTQLNKGDMLDVYGSISSVYRSEENGYTLQVREYRSLNEYVRTSDFWIRWLKHNFWFLLPDQKRQ